jgi:hypothetical protein
MAIVVMVLMLAVIVGAINRWIQLLRVKTPVKDPHAELVLEVVPD